MNAVTIHVDEQVYSYFQESARTSQRSTSDLVREAMAEHHDRLKRTRQLSLRDAPAPVSVGEVLQSWRGRTDLLDDYFERE